MTLRGRLCMKDIQEILFTSEQISGRIQELGQEITKEYLGKDPVFVGILKGAVPFIADLIRAVDLPLVYDFMAVSSYGASTKSSGTVRILKDLDLAIEDRDLLIVEDIVDTGLTLQYLMESFRSRQVRSMKVCTLLDKPSRRKKVIQPDFNGFVIPDVFVVGYGLDYNEKYRNLPFIGVLKEEVYRRETE